ncbi:hypothetical protein F0562_023471 [Nyssa sinensis]|uniref:Uncharacterized protein n=1 Tax=Nyssa sinensis TaxID=561372 RepID=A0A5J5BGS8_9ASTE|nr:hypothetical protein F0562_023471 [Nyssa sinensis]
MSSKGSEFFIFKVLQHDTILPDQEPNAFPIQFHVQDVTMVSHEPQPITQGPITIGTFTVLHQLFNYEPLDEARTTSSAVLPFIVKIGVVTIQPRDQKDEEELIARISSLSVEDGMSMSDPTSESLAQMLEKLPLQG